MLKTEIAELMSKDNKMYEVAQKVEYKLDMTAEEKEIADVCDSWAREIGKTGYDKDHEIAAYIQRTVNTEIYNAPDELLDRMFVKGTIGEFDDVEVIKTPKNTLVAYEAAKGGNVDKSWIDITGATPKHRNFQVETDVSYVDLRKNGFKSIATLTTYAKEALQNKLFYSIFNDIDKLITGGAQLINVTGAVPTITAIDELELYLSDRSTNPMAVMLTRYAQAIGRMNGFSQYMSESMKDNFNRYGLVDFYGRMNIAAIPAAHKQGNGDLLIPDKMIFGIAGQIGSLDMQGEIHVYEDADNNKEAINLKVADFTVNYAITDLDKVAKVVFSA